MNLNKLETEIFLSNVSAADIRDGRAGAANTIDEMKSRVNA